MAVGTQAAVEAAETGQDEEEEVRCAAGVGERQVAAASFGVE